VEESRLQLLSWTPWHHRLHQQLLTAPNLLPQGKTLVIAVSGGQDSMALLGLLRDLMAVHQWRLLLWHGDHHWHPHSGQIASELKQWCDDQGLALQVETAPEELPQTEADARTWRYRCLTQLTNASGADAVTGHTASDRAETLLLQASRGSDLAGLGSLRAVRPLQAHAPEEAQLRRPLLGFSRNETVQICSDLQLPIWNDPGNQSTDFTRNRIRHEVMPVLEELNPGSSRRLADLAERMSQLRDTQHNLAALALTTLQSNEGLDRKALGLLPQPTRRQLLAQWLNQQGVPGLDAPTLEQLSHRLRQAAPASEAHLPKGWILSWQGSDLILQPPAAGH
jgi:tRNA(Ile)-lysidine synthase